MPSRFDAYRMRDGVTPLAASYFNPLLQDVDLRINTLEALKINWTEAIQELNTQGLLRINEIIAPAALSIDALVATATTQSGQLAADITAAGTSLAAAVSAAETSLAAAFAANLATMTAAFSVSTFIPPAPGIITLPAGFDGQLLLAEGYGVYKFSSASTATVNGESVVAPATGAGRWLLIAPSWDYVYAYMAVYLDALLPLAVSATLDFPSIATLGSATLTVTVTGAALIDAVVLVAPPALPVGLIAKAYVSAADTITVRMDNLTAGAVDLAALSYLITVIKGG
jgi:hypothetical protein